MTSKILQVVRMVPAGKVISYGQIAMYTGNPKEAREVGWAMRELGKNHDIPWWRVINNAGEISINGNPDADAKMQRSLLENEGVKVSEELKVDMDKYRFRLDAATLKQFGFDDEYIKTAIKKFEPPRQASFFDVLNV